MVSQEVSLNWIVSALVTYFFSRSFAGCRNLSDDRQSKPEEVSAILCLLN